jgi:hypothetical protein
MGLEYRPFTNRKLRSVLAMLSIPDSHRRYIIIIAFEDATSSAGIGDLVSCYFDTRAVCRTCIFLVHQVIIRVHVKKYTGY